MFDLCEDRAMKLTLCIKLAIKHTHTHKAIKLKLCTERAIKPEFWEDREFQLDLCKNRAIKLQLCLERPSKLDLCTNRTIKLNLCKELAVKHIVCTNRPIKVKSCPNMLSSLTTAESCTSALLVCRCMFSNRRPQFCNIVVPVVVLQISLRIAPTCRSF